MKIWELDDGEQHWYAANTRDEVMEMHVEPIRKGDGTVDFKGEFGMEEDEIEITALSDDTVLPVRQDDGSVISKTAAEWAVDGMGPVASTAW